MHGLNRWRWIKHRDNFTLMYKLYISSSGCLNPLAPLAVLCLSPKQELPAASKLFIGYFRNCYLGSGGCLL
jgi:hypothetical protein